MPCTACIRSWNDTRFCDNASEASCEFKKSSSIIIILTTTISRYRIPDIWSAFASLILNKRKSLELKTNDKTSWTGLFYNVEKQKLWASFRDTLKRNIRYIFENCFSGVLFWLSDKIGFLDESICIFTNF